MTSKTTHTFNSKEEAMLFVKKESSNLLSQKAIVQCLLTDDDLISQDHFSFFDFKRNLRKDISVLQFSDKVIVTIEDLRYSRLVLAAEYGDLELFKKYYTLQVATNAQSLAFSRAIGEGRFEIVEYIVNNNLDKRMSLFKVPMQMAAEADQVEIFEFLWQKDADLPDELLACILYNNSSNVLWFIINHPTLSNIIRETRFMTNYAQNVLQRKENEAIKLFKNHLGLI